MADLIKQINEDLATGQKKGDKIRVEVLRMVKAAIKEKEIELKRELKKEELIKILISQVKSREDSIDQFKKADRSDLWEKEMKEVEIIKAYLPKELALEELDKLITQVIDEVDAKTKADIGKVMGPLMAKVAGRANGETVKDMVLDKLS